MKLFKDIFDASAATFEYTLVHCPLTGIAAAFNTAVSPIALLSSGTALVRDLIHHDSLLDIQDDIKNVAIYSTLTAPSLLMVAFENQSTLTFSDTVGNFMMSHLFITSPVAFAAGVFYGAGKAAQFFVKELQLNLNQ